MYYDTNLEFCGVDFTAQIEFKHTPVLMATMDCPGEPSQTEIREIQLKMGDSWVDVTESVLSFGFKVESAIIEEIEDNQAEWH